MLPEIKGWHRGEVAACNTGHISRRAHTPLLLATQPRGKQSWAVGDLLRKPGAEVFSAGAQEAAWLPEASHLHTWVAAAGREWLALQAARRITSSNLPWCPMWDLGSCSALSCLAV